MNRNVWKALKPRSEHASGRRATLSDYGTRPRCAIALGSLWTSLHAAPRLKSEGSKNVKIEAKVSVVGLGDEADEDVENEDQVCESEPCTCYESDCRAKTLGGEASIAAEKAEAEERRRHDKLDMDVRARPDKEDTRDRTQERILWIGALITKK
ncbi:hypothetical protein GQ600_27416 [Phytophthora cactorum]|nr:hypothetical protein GQ600_27416 [Phytophthora cactorum]